MTDNVKIKGKVKTMVRKATQTDIPAILKLYREHFGVMAKYIPDFIKEGDQSTEFIEKIISNENSDILVYNEDNTVVGFILLQEQIRSDFDFIVNAGSKSCYIMDLIVTEDSRNKGYGTALMNATKEWQ